MPICDIYCRFSERPDADESRSLDVQEAKGRSYAAFAGLEIGELICDPETSARTVPLWQRKGGARLLERQRLKQSHGVIALRLDRLFRSVVDGMVTMTKWNRKRYALHLVAEGGQSVNSSTAFGRMIIGQRLLASQFEAELTAERTSEAMHCHMRNNLRMSSRLPYGFQIDPQSPPHPESGIPTGMQRCDEEQANIERVLFLRRGGKNNEEVARSMNQAGLTFRGKPWTRDRVRKIVLRHESQQREA